MRWFVFSLLHFRSLSIDNVTASYWSIHDPKRNHQTPAVADNRNIMLFYTQQIDFESSASWCAGAVDPIQFSISLKFPKIILVTKVKNLLNISNRQKIINNPLIMSDLSRVWEAITAIPAQQNVIRLGCQTFRDQIQHGATEQICKRPNANTVPWSTSVFKH